MKLSVIILSFARARASASVIGILTQRILNNLKYERH